MKSIHLNDKCSELTPGVHNTFGTRNHTDVELNSFWGFLCTFLLWASALALSNVIQQYYVHDFASALWTVSNFLTLISHFNLLWQVKHPPWIIPGMLRLPNGLLRCEKQKCSYLLRKSCTVIWSEISSELENLFISSGGEKWKRCRHNSNNVFFVTWLLLEINRYQDT